MPFPKFAKIPRFNREVTITEKIDGTNAVIGVVAEDDLYTRMEYGITDNDILDQANGHLLVAGSRSRWITPNKDNYGFALWASENSHHLFELGAGLHYGEWYGSGINRGYGRDKGDKRFMLFNTSRWAEERPEVCEVSTVLWEGNGRDIGPGAAWAIEVLRQDGSKHVPGFERPEGIVIYHHAANHLYKVLLENDELPKGLVDG